MRADESQPWFQSSGELVERLKASRRAEARVPEVEATATWSPSAVGDRASCSPPGGTKMGVVWP